MADNNVTVSGNLTRSPDLRYTPSGRPVANFGLAVNRRWQNKTTNEWEEAVSFLNVVAWGGLAESAAQSLDKGHRVTVSGRLEQRSWETDEGEKRSIVEIVADDIGASLKWATVEITRTEREKIGQQATDEQYVPPDAEEPF
jgi:single-strand DNA-binding protein